jgi:hypothetical protein
VCSLGFATYIQEVIPYILLLGDPCCNPFLDPYKNKKIKRKKENTSK